MNPKKGITPKDLELVFPDPDAPLLTHSPPKITWDEWMTECAVRTNAYLKNYDRINDPTVHAHVVRFSLHD